MSPRLFVPVVLSLCLGVLIYLYWREGDELQSSRTANKQLQKELTLSRGERDQLQFKFNLLREDVESAQQAHEESERRVQELDEQLQEELGKLRASRQELSVSQAKMETMENSAKECKDKSATLEEVVDQLRMQLSECEAEGKETTADNAKLHHEQEVLKEEVNRRSREKDRLLLKVSEAEEKRQTCSQELAGCISQWISDGENERASGCSKGQVSTGVSSGAGRDDLPS